MKFSAEYEKHLHEVSIMRKIKNDIIEKFNVSVSNKIKASIRLGDGLNEKNAD